MTRSRLLLALPLLVSCLVLSPSARADDAPIGGVQRERQYESPQRFAAELRFSPYRPQIDDEPGLALKDPSRPELGRETPYADAFGSTPRLMVALEVDWQALRIPYVGTIGPGLAAGYTSMSASVTTTSGRASGDQTSLDIYPFWGAAVLRGDELYRKLRIPLVPYGKLGVSYALWRASNTGSTSQAPVPGTTPPQIVSGKGHTWGTYAALGLSFALDALDRGAARNFDETLGINHTYIFGEYYFLGLDGLGQSNALRVGSNTWAAGLAFEF